MHEGNKWNIERKTVVNYQIEYWILSIIHSRMSYPLGRCMHYTLSTNTHLLSYFHGLSATMIANFFVLYIALFNIGLSFHMKFAAVQTFGEFVVYFVYLFIYDTCVWLHNKFQVLTSSYRTSTDICTRGHTFACERERVKQNLLVHQTTNWRIEMRFYTDMFINFMKWA